jgi:putative intracellular protease/amidase
MMKIFGVLLFDDFETLDAFGPAEIMGKLSEEFELHYYSMTGGIVKSSQQVQVVTEHFSAFPEAQVLLVPGGMGTRQLVRDKAFIACLADKAEKAAYVLSVCTGAALLAQTPLLNGRLATSNKRAFDWVKSQNQQVHWQAKARWCRDEQVYSSSGVSAGMDMILGFIADQYGQQKAQEIAHRIEYSWQDDATLDPFSCVQVDK